MTVVENDTPALDQTRVVEDRFRRALAERDAALRHNLALCRLDAEKDDIIRGLRRANEAKDLEIARHRAATAARAAVEAEAANAKPAHRPLAPREHLLATVFVLAVLAALCGLAAPSVALLLGGLVVLGVSGAALAVCRSAPDPGRPFDLDPDAPKRTVHRG